MFHIPPGRSILAKQEWKDKYQDQFLSLLKTYKSKIKTNIIGHLHLEALHSFVDCTSWEPYGYGLLNPSISPIFNNNPAFRIYRFSHSPVKLESYVDHFVLLNNYNDDRNVNKAKRISNYWNLNYSVTLPYGAEYSAFSVFLYWLDTLDNNKSLLVNMLSTMGWDSHRDD